MSETHYFRKLSEIINVPEPDTLTQKNCISDSISISVAGIYQRGMLLMSSGTDFVPATAEGLASAEEICILADNLALEENSGDAIVSAYFAGEFNPDAIILPYEGEEDDHSTLLEAIAKTLRKNRIFLK